MKKIPTMFKRNPENMRELLDEQHPDCDWVFKGEGVATQKLDGTCCMIKDGGFFKRREVKKDKPEPFGFIKEDYDPVTGKEFGWVPVEHSDKWHLEGLEHLKEHLKKGWGKTPQDGTYELIGPKVQGNPEDWPTHDLILHETVSQFHDAPRTMEALKEWLSDKKLEGLVFHHPDGRMAKIKKKDFGLKRNTK